MNITSSDIINLSHALKDVCEVDCGTAPCLTQTLRTVLQYNLIMANLKYSQKLREPEPSSGQSDNALEPSYSPLRRFPR